MSLTGANLLVGLSEFVGDYHVSATTGAGSPTALVDTGLRKFGGDDVLRGWYLRITEPAHTAIFEVRRITSFSSATGTCIVSPAFSATTGIAKAYELHRYDPTKKFTALDEARLQAYPELCEVVFDDTITGDGYSHSFAIPSTMRDGPFLVQEEVPPSADVNWNFDGDPLGSLTAKWTASNATLSTYSRNEADSLIPKYDDTALTITVAASTAATVTQVVGSMTNGITAALAAGRTMTVARAVYSTVASKIRLQLIDDTTTTSGSYHGGNGWELLTVEKDIIGSNATTLSVRLDIASTASPLTAAVSRGWLYFGPVERIVDSYNYTMAKIVRRDDATRRVYLDRPIKRGYQMRMIGRDTLSALGRTASTQVTNTMEVDEQSAQLLYAIAGQILFEREGLQSTDPDTQNRIATVLGRRMEFGSKFTYGLPTVTRLRGMWQ